MLDDPLPKNLIVYEIVYIPWANNTENKPWKYIGSTTKSLECYFGSVSSKQWKSFWKTETKANPQNFQKRIICNCISNDANRIHLREIERSIQQEQNVVKSREYFNKSLATVNGFMGMDVSGEANPNFGKRRDDNWKMRHQKVMSEISSRPEVKRLRSEVQKVVQSRPEVAKNKSEKQKARWEDSSSKLVNSKNSQFKPTVYAFGDKIFNSKADLVAFCRYRGYNATYATRCTSVKELEAVADLFRFGLNKSNRRQIVRYAMSDRMEVPNSWTSHKKWERDLIDENFSEIQSLLHLINNGNNNFLKRLFSLNG